MSTGTQSTFAHLKNASGVLLVGVPSLLLLYGVLRLLAWENVQLFEDHDSILYLQQIEAFMGFDRSAIRALSPDTTPFYPFFSALAALPSGSAEFGARFFSFLSSLILFVAIAGILNRIDRPTAVLIGLGVLSLLPYLITFSISVLSEPAYLGVIYCGLWYYLAKYQSDKWWHAVGLGVVFGLSFLNRIEGILFLVLIPVFQGVYFVSSRGLTLAAIRHTLRWSGIFAAGFTLVAAPQVLVVSDKMNQFALNGRQVWAQILQSPDEGSFDEKIYGLDHSPSEINLTYLQRHPESLSDSTSQLSIVHSAETLIRNIDLMYAVRIGPMGGSLLVAFFVFGLLALFERKRYLETVYLLLFAGAVVAPALVTDPKPRALAAALPLLAALCGPGVAYASNKLSAPFEQRWPRYIAPTALLTLIALAWMVPLFGIYLKERRENAEYSLTDLAPVESLVRQTSSSRSNRPLRMTARKRYLAYLSEAEFLPLPYTDYEGLVEYVESNDIDLLFLQDRVTSDFPFTEAFRDGTSARHWIRIYNATDSAGNPLALYRFRP